MKTDLKEYLVLFFGLVGTFFAPAIGIIAALIFAAVIDHIFGVWKAVKKKEKVSLWVGIWTTLTKIVLYTGIMLAVFAIDRTAVNDIITAIAGKQEIKYIFTKLGALALFSIELYSINRSYKDVKGQSLFSALMGALGKAKKVSNEIGKIKSGAAIALILGLIIYGCSTARRAERHLVKAQQLGAVCGKIDTIKVLRLDTVTNTYKYFDSLTIVNDRIVPLTNLEIRYKYRITRDTIKQKETIIKEQQQTARAEIVNREPTFKEVAIQAFKMLIVFIIALVVLFFGYHIFKTWRQKK